jgi:hypothetical protein
MTQPSTNLHGSTFSGDGERALLINATSLGMRPDDDLPVSERVVERAGLMSA